MLYNTFIIIIKIALGAAEMYLNEIKKNQIFI